MKFKLANSFLSGTISAPPSKSHTLRAILFASLADGKSHIKSYLKSPDTTAMINACEKIGAKIKVFDNDIHIDGVSGKPCRPDDVVDAGNSGQVLRFITAVLSILDGYSVITGDNSIRYNRPMGDLILGLQALGAECYSLKQDDFAPIIVKGPIAPGTAILNGKDSQPVSALLIAAAFLTGDTIIKIAAAGEKPWINLTLSWFDFLGISYTNDNFKEITVHASVVPKGFIYSVPGDFSSMAYPLIAAIITNSAVTIKNLNISDVQGDKKIIAVLKSMGANLEITEDAISTNGKQDLLAHDIDVNDLIDAVPILAVLSCFINGSMSLVNISNARNKESDRLAAITQELRLMGADVIEHHDSLTISGKKLIGAKLTSHNDHRIAMSLAVAALATSTASELHGVACINKSYPGFFDDMLALGANIELVS